jgi:hypothetical protein
MRVSHAVATRQTKFSGSNSGSTSTLRHPRSADRPVGIDLRGLSGSRPSNRHYVGLLDDLGSLYPLPPEDNVHRHGTTQVSSEIISSRRKNLANCSNSPILDPHPACRPALRSLDAPGIRSGRMGFPLPGPSNGAGLCGRGVLGFRSDSSRKLSPGAPFLQGTARVGLRSLQRSSWRTLPCGRERLRFQRAALTESWRGVPAKSCNRPELS